MESRALLARAPLYSLAQSRSFVAALLRMTTRSTRHALRVPRPASRELISLHLVSTLLGMMTAYELLRPATSIAVALLVLAGRPAPAQNSSSAGRPRTLSATDRIAIDALFKAHDTPHSP